ncbi:protein C-ets-1-like isoform X2 [Varroa destructor]|uniref:ETS domain-containing protein n=1 Tax=Varroa destructor TaxID=109461 RepID=A0A7M7M6L4_VARDE|nr:protein C-ets-1-like isoform X2 [Varroa destructor]
MEFEEVLGFTPDVIHIYQQAMCSPGHYYPSPAWSPPSSEADYVTGGLGLVKNEPLSPQGALVGAGMNSPRAGHTAPSVTPPPTTTLYHAHMPSTELNGNNITGYAPLTPPYNSNNNNRQSPSQSAYWMSAGSTTPPPYESEYYSSGTCSPRHTDVHETKYADVLLHQVQHSSPSPNVNKQITATHPATSNSAPNNSSSSSSSSSSINSNGNSAGTAGCLEGLNDDGALEQLRAICLQQAASDVQVACHMLNISPNPNSWNIHDVQRWILWLVKEEKLEYAAEHMHVFSKVNGARLVTLCDNYQKMSLQQGPQVVSAQRLMVETVCAHLDIWKSAAQTIGCATSANTTDANSSNNSDRTGDNSACHHGQQLQITSTISNNSFSSLHTQDCNQQLDDIDLLPYQLSQVPDYVALHQHQQQHHHSSYSAQHVTTPGQMSGTQTLKYPLAAYGGATGLEIQLNAASTCSSSMYPGHSSPPLYGDLNEEGYSDDEECSSGGSLGPSGAGQHIHLWQFLKELLSDPHQHHNCIRWLDRAKGIFKIEDSVRVAKLWGRRKNRPAMNYDKLSRSIRQYYRKGIMKKTERSQRLVYQFCPAYAN